MFTYIDRVEGFSKWPNQFKDTFVKKLAILGQYSVDHTNTSSCCIYCKQKHKGWKVTDVPLLEHFKSNPKCTIFKLQTYKNRKEHATIGENDEKKIEGSSDNLEGSMKKAKKIIEKNLENNDLLEDKFIKIIVSKNCSFYACAVCGNMSKSHECPLDEKKYRYVQKLNPNADQSTAQFYIRFLNGDYNSFIETILILSKDTVLVKNIQSNFNLLKYLFNINPSYECFDSFESFLAQSSELLIKELGPEMRSIENKAIVSISDDSVVFDSY